MNYKFKKPYPYKHQVRALKLLIQNNGGALFIPMRGGKSRVVVDFAGVLKQKYGVDRVLIICPLSVIGVWRMEIKKWSTARDIEWKIINFEQLATRVRYETDDGYGFQMEDNQELFDFNPGLIVIDESHRIGKPTTLWSRKAFRLQKKLGVKYKVIMTGTPVHRKLFNAFGGFKFLDETIFGTDWGAYKKQYGLFGGWNNTTLVKYINLKLWREKVRSVAFTMAHVPPRAPVHQVIPVDLESSRDVYNTLAHTSVLRISQDVIESPLIVTRLLRLAQICGGHLKGEEKTHVVGREKRDTFADLMEQFTDNEVDKIVVFVRFVQEIKDVAEVAKAAEYRVYLLHGGVSGPEREQRIEAFQTGKGRSVFVAQISAGSVGIDLSAADTAVFYSLSESLIDYDQACARIRTYKDKRVLTYYYLLARNSVDEVIYMALNEKLDLAEFVMRHPSILNHVVKA